jgi:phosphodiesterase/alkaline phosphatase D-like protein
VNNTGSYNNKTLALQTIEKSYLDYHPTRVAILGSPASGYALVGPQVIAPTDPRSNGTLQLYFAQQWGANSIYVQTDDRSYRDIRLAKLAGNRTIDDVGSRADSPERTMLGSTQLQWLEATLLQAQQDRIPWKFVVISSPIDQVGGAPVQDGKSRWGGYRSERDRLLKFIADNRIGHVVFLATDDHQTRVTQ